MGQDGGLHICADFSARGCTLMIAVRDCPFSFRSRLWPAQSAEGPRSRWGLLSPRAHRAARRQANRSFAICLLAWPGAPVAANKEGK